MLTDSYTRVEFFLLKTIPRKVGVILVAMIQLTDDKFNLKNCKTIWPRLRLDYTSFFFFFLIIHGFWLSLGFGYLLGRNYLSIHWLFYGMVLMDFKLEGKDWLDSIELANMIAFFFFPVYNMNSLPKRVKIEMFLSFVTLIKRVSIRWWLVCLINFAITAVSP